MPSLTDYLVTDDLTVLLVLIGVTTFLVRSLYKPQPLVHPILLGRQSDVARVRVPGESAVYRNYSTGMMGRFPVRPNKDVKVISDLVQVASDARRTLWSDKIANPDLNARVTAFGNGLLRVLNLQAHESNVLLLLNDSLEFIISDVALSQHSITSITVSSTNLVAPILESHPPSAIITHAPFLPQLLKLIPEASPQKVVVTGEFDQTKLAIPSHIQVLKWTDVENEGKKTEVIITPAASPNDVFTISFYTSESGQLQGAQLTHENITSGVTAIRALFPLNNPISALDTIVSAYPLGTAYGRAIAYTAIYEGTSFATFASSKMFRGDREKAAPVNVSDVLSPLDTYNVPPPTIIFVKPAHLTPITTSILSQAKESFILHAFAMRHKKSALSEGFITKDSLWDRLVFDGARNHVLGPASASIRMVVVSGGPLAAEAITPARIAFSVPFVNAYTHSLISGPVLATHALDLQDFTSVLGKKDQFSPVAAYGAPSINIEAKLVGVVDSDVEAGLDPVGALFVRGASVGRLLPVGGKIDESWVGVPPPVGDTMNWVEVGAQGKMFTNGVLKVVTGK